MESFTVTVYPTDIKSGRRGNAQECPVALSMMRATNWRYVVSVTSRIRLVERRTCRIAAEYSIPEEMTDFIKLFDAGHMTPHTKAFKLRGSLPKD